MSQAIVVGAGLAGLASGPSLAYKRSCRVRARVTTPIKTRCNCLRNCRT
jgi:succinate dehydrogenase/fumarate reductase flavoprotein subunit